MQAMTVTARSIPNNLFLEQMKKRQLQRHTNKVIEIMTLRNQKLKTMEVESEKISGVLRKAKEAAKQFESKEKEIVRKKENKILLEKLWRISEGKVNMGIPATDEMDPTMKHINHRAEFQKRVSERIVEENKYLAKNLIEQSKNKRSKSQIKSQIKEYLALRDSIRKHKSPQQAPKRLTKSKSQLKKRMSQLSQKPPQEKRSPIEHL